MRVVKHKRVISANACDLGEIEFKTILFSQDVGKGGAESQGVAGTTEIAITAETVTVASLFLQTRALGRGVENRKIPESG